MSFAICSKGLVVLLLVLLGFLSVLCLSPSGVEGSTALQSGDSPLDEDPSFDVDMYVMIVILLFVMVLFLWEPVRVDFIALSLPIILVVFGHWTGISSADALLGFSSKATVTVLAMFVLSEGIRRSGVMQIVGNWIRRITGNSEVQQLGVISTISGFLAGFINNTPVVSMFIPMVDDVSKRTRTSPSRLLIPLSYAAMMGGTLTLIGTSTNLLASDISSRLIDRPFGMFEFTKLGLVVLTVGLIYLVTVGRFLVPERINPEQTMVEKYEMGQYLTEVIIDRDSELRGLTIEEIREQTGLELNFIHLVRDGERMDQHLDELTVKAGDHLLISNDKTTLSAFVTRPDVSLVPGFKVSVDHVVDSVHDMTLVEVVVGHGPVEGNTLRELNFSQRFNTPILAMQRGEILSHHSLDQVPLEPGDVLLVLATEESIQRLHVNRNYIVAHEFSPEELRPDRMILSLGIVTGVVGLAAFQILDIAIAALAGVLCMVFTGTLKPRGVYRSVDWEVIFLLAGLIPLGIALQRTGTAEFVARTILYYLSSWPGVVLLGVFYLLTAVLTNIISNNASVVLMIPIAVDAATQLGANPFSFVLVVTFAASTAFMTPVGYQTNLMVYGPGRYRFFDFVRAGLPLQLLMTVVIPAGVYLFWGV